MTVIRGHGKVFSMAYKVSKRLKRIIDGTGGMTSASAGVGAAITGVAVTAAKSSGNAGNAGNGGNNTGSSSGISGYTPTRFTPASESGSKYTVSSAVKRRASSDAALRRNGLARVNSAPDTDDTSVDDYYRELNDVGSTLFDWSGGSSYVDADTRKTLSDRINVLSSGYGDIRNYALERAAKEGYSDDDVKALAESLKSTENYLDSLGKAYGDINSYYSKFADRDTYLAALEDYDKYGIFAASDDFDTKSAAGKARYETEKQKTIETDYSDGLSDKRYSGYKPGRFSGIENEYNDLTSSYEDRLSEADRAKYYALYADDPERADEFARYAVERQYIQKMQKISEWAGENAGTAILADAASLLLTPMTVDKSAMYTIDRILNGTEDKARYTVTASDIQSALQQGVDGAIEKATEGLPGSDGLWITGGRNVYSFLHDTGFSMVQSAAIVSTLGPAGSIILGGGAASSAMTDAYDRGASPDQVLAEGLLGGTFETLFEYVSLDKLVKLGSADTVADAIKSILIQGGVEGSEEFFTTLANTAADYLIMSDKSQYALDVAENLAAGMSDKEAKLNAGVNIMQSLVSDTLAGFISGAGMAGGKVGYTSVSEGIADSKAGAAIRAAGNAEELIGQIKKITGSARTSLDYIDRVGLDASSAGMQTEEAGAGNRAKDRRTQRQLGRALRYFGYDTIENSADAAVGKYDSSGVMSYDDYLAAREEARQEAARKWRDEGAPAFTRAASGKTQAADNAAAGSSGSGNTAEAASDQEQTTFDNADIYDEELPFDTSEDEPTGTDWKQEIAGYAKANGISDKGARLLEEQYSSEVSLFGSYAQTAQDFAKQWDLAYTYGRTGRMRLSDVAAQLGNDVVTQFSAAYELGLSEYRERQAARYKKAAESNKLTLGGNMRLISEEEAAKYNVNTVTEELDGDRRVQVEALREFLAGSPANAVFYESNRNELGKSIGEQGFYDPETHTMYIDVNAGNNGEGAILRTAAHELTHMLQQTAPKEYDALADFVINYFYSADPAAVGQLVADKVIRAQENGRSMGEAAALNDIVADACENMLTDADALSALSNENRTLFERFKAWLDEMIGRLKAAISKFGKGSKAGELLGQDLKSFESARRLWFDAYKAAAERTTGNTDSGTDIKADTYRASENSDIGTDINTDEAENVQNRDGERDMDNLLESILKKMTSGETEQITEDGGDNNSTVGGTETTDGGDEDIELSDRDTDVFSDREILTMALDETVDDPDERSALETYKKLLPKIKEYTAILDDIKKQIHSLTFDKSTHVGDWRARLETLRTRRDAIAKRVAAADKQLLDMEHAPVLQGIIDRQRQSLEKRDRYIRKLETRFDEYKESRTQSELRSRFLPKVESMVGSLTKEVTSPTRTRHVPEALREPLARFLASIDMSSPTMLAGTRVLDKDAEFAESLDRLYDVIREYSSSSATDAESGIAGYGDFDIAPQLAGWLNDLRKSTESIIAEAGNPGSDGFVLSRMSGRQLQELARILRSLSATAHNAGKFISSESTKYISDIAESAVKTLDAMPERDYKNGTVESFLKYDNMTPVYVFDRYGDAGKEIFRLVTQGQSKLAEHIEEIRGFCSDAFTPEQREAWSNQIHEVQLGGRTERMSTAQIMDLYLLTKRKQARGHLLGEGFRIGELKLKEKNKKNGSSRVAVHGGATVSEIELASIIAKLTPEQIETADKLQKFASTVGARWGNEITMKRWGYRHYTELNYWPIVTDETTRDVKSNDKKGTAYSSLYRIINGSFTKEIVPNANNRIVVDNIFEVFSSHMAQMAQLNAMGLQTVDTVRWLNYRVKNEDGSEYNLRRSSERALGKPAERYLLQLLDEMNGARVTGQDEGIGNAAISRYNRAQVMFNMRVAIQQPFSIIRAANEMSPKYLSKACRGVTNLKKLSAEMEQYSGEAKWKFTLGFTRPELAQNADVLLEKKQTAISKLAEASTALAEKGDHLTWTVLWNACRLEVADKNPGIVKNNSEYMSAVGERFSDIVYRTQVFDSIFAKSQWMRNGTFYHRLTSSFMAEPTLDYNVLASRAIKLSELKRAGKQGSAAWKSAMKDFLRASSVFCASGIVNAVVTAFADAWRDDDDYETFAEKYLDAFRGNLIDNLIPTDLLPLSNTLTDYAKTALGLVLDLAGVENNIYGYESRRTDMEHLQLMVDALEYTGKFFGGSGSYTAYGMAYSWMRALSAATGIPVAAASREAASAFNNIADIWNNTMDFMGKSAYLPKLQTRTTSASAGYEALARAYTEGDEKAAARLRRELSGNLKGEGAEKDGKIADGVRSAFRTLFDSGNGGITDEEMLTLLIEYGGIDENEAYFTVEKWKSDVPAEYSRYDAYFEALDSGDSAAARERLAELTSHGVDEPSARSAVTSRYRKAYLAADETERADIRRRMKKTGLYTSAQLEKLTKGWEAAGSN